MKWGRKKNPIKQQDDDDVKKPSTFSLSNLLPLSWLFKQKHKPKPNNINNPKPTTAPTPTPLFSPPPLAPTRTHSHSHSHLLSPRRLSTGDADAQLPRSLPRPRHHSLGSELDFPFPFPNPTRTRRPRRRKHPDLKPIRAGPEPDLIRGGRRSFSGGRIRPRVRVYSPRLANPNPIARERGGGGLERFAVVKRTSDPVRDFRESMVEMIWERGIGRPEELERLLACYLALNSDEHHDLIVKVFRQVWFDLNREVDRVRGLLL